MRGGTQGARATRTIRKWLQFGGRKKKSLKTEGLRVKQNQ